MAGFLPNPALAGGGVGHCYAPVANVAVTVTRGGADIAWDCSDGTPSIAPQAVAVRLALDASPAYASQGANEANLPRYLITRQGRFDSLTLIARDSDGAFRTVRYNSRQVQPTYIDAKFTARLPKITADTTAIIAIFERPLAGVMLQQSELTTKRPLHSKHGLTVLLLTAMICGFLLLPVMFDMVFYRALRETVALWHAAMAAGFALHLATSGLILFVIPLTNPEITHLATISFSMLLVAAIMFSRAMIEPGNLHPQLRQGLLACAIMSISMTAVLSFPWEFTRPWIHTAYFAVHTPILLFLLVCAIDAWRRGSRAIRFLAVAWAPFVLLGVIRVLTHLTPIAAADDALWLFRYAAVFEIAVTSIAVTDRFSSLRRQRDTALRKALRMVNVAEHDQLTGLHNRRALERQFEDLRFKGFDTFAVLDLDKFKDVNDTHGHTVGDEVLGAMGEALKAHPDRDVRSFRLGGEEFVLLLRGKQATRRAEALRQMIPGQIAARVEGLGAPVTASMGIVEVPRNGLAAMHLLDLYARADKLLYEAKAAGRNRTVSEKLTVFARSPAKYSNAERRRNRRTDAA